MKNSGLSGPHRRRWGFVLLTGILAMLLVFSVGTVVSASSGGNESAAAESHGEEAGHGEAESHGPGWIKTDTYRVLHFIILAGGLFFLLRKPLSQALNVRIEGIEEQLNDLESQKAEAEKQLAEYNQKFAQLEKEAGKIMAEYVRQGEDAKVRILKEAEESAEKLKIQAQKSIEGEFERARNELQTEVLGKALAKAEEIIKSKISAEDQEKLVDEYLAKVVAS
ncbi:MAG: ATP synthase F0 subunit B [Desulfosarcina sp.]|nr:ATP synthase F0 subunit B [Desulfobacterales bacterium]